jgi:hypothetical protein
MKTMNKYGFALAGTLALAFLTIMVSPATADPVSPGTKETFLCKDSLDFHCHQDLIDFWEEGGSYSGYCDQMYRIYAPVDAKIKFVNPQGSEDASQIVYNFAHKIEEFWTTDLTVKTPGTVTIDRPSGDKPLILHAVQAPSV